MKKLTLLFALACAGCGLQQMRDDASPSVQLAKYGRTCEGIGHVPGTPGYHRCVAQLSSAVAPAGAPAAPREDSPIDETIRER